MKLGVIQTRTYDTDVKNISKISQILKNAGRKEADIVCLPEQWLKYNKILNFEQKFVEFKKIARDYAITIILGAFYEKARASYKIVAPVIDPSGNIIGKQEKIHPFGYEKKTIIAGNQAKIFKTSCKFGIAICYDMVFPDVVKTLAEKGAEVIFSPSRIVKRGIIPWHMYVQVRALENRIPILAANVENTKFGGNSIIVDLEEHKNIMIPKTTKISKEALILRNFDLQKYQKSRLSRFSDHRKFR